MSRRPRSLARVGVRFLAILVGMFGVWIVFLEPGYSRFVAVTGTEILRLVESPPMTASVRLVGDGTARIARTATFASVPVQRIDMRSLHNNMPFLIALILATPGLTRRRRNRVLAIGMVLLGSTHVLEFMLDVHWHYALANAGPYRVTDLRYLDRTFWESLDNGAQTAKVLIFHVSHFYSHIGRRLAPVLLWIALCWPALTRYSTNRVQRA